ncbi:MAG: hypothetical protein ACK56I_32490, partial [bacterium]
VHVVMVSSPSLPCVCVCACVFVCVCACSNDDLFLWVWHCNACRHAARRADCEQRPRHLARVFIIVMLGY